MFTNQFVTAVAAKPITPISSCVMRASFRVSRLWDVTGLTFLKCSKTEPASLEINLVVEKGRSQEANAALSEPGTK